MDTPRQRRRIDLDAELFDELERQARWLHMPANALAAMLITEGLQRYEKGARPGPRSSLAAQIVREGSPSPTLATLRRHAEDELTK